MNRQQGWNAHQRFMSSVSPYPKKRKGVSFPETPLAIVCPADAVLAKLPFPSKQGWITVGALLTSNQGLSLNRAQPSLHGINHIGFGALARNPEHRRAKYMFLPWKVVQKSEKNYYSRSVTPRRSTSNPFSRWCTAFTSSWVSVRSVARYVKLQAIDLRSFRIFSPVGSTKRSKI